VAYHDRYLLTAHPAGNDMSKNTFFLRQQLIAPNDETFPTNEIDLGAFVNLGSTKPQVLRVHSVQISFTDSQGLVPTIKEATSPADAKSAFCSFSITTKERASGNLIPMLSDDETMFTASIVGTNLNDDDDQGIYSDAMDIAPQHLVNGYLVGVDTLHLYACADDAWAESVYISVCLECSVEAVTKENAVNLALSQS
tara:strand:- start:266 stop:856 length:591 start_codon:yes stop_codon:yes gene_type:complete